ncbi:MAG: hypothetical protein ACI89X_000855 [Planctomycetota bacterium]|jgi:hypothetical protein
MKKIASVVLSILALTLLASCGGDVVASAAGKYTLDTEAAVAAAKAAIPSDAPTEGPAAEMAKMGITFLESMKGSLELKADNTVLLSMTMSMMGKEQTQATNGTWKLEGDKLTLTTKEEGKDDVVKVATFVDGVITVEDENGAMTFKKAE